MSGSLRCDTLSGDFKIFQPENGQRYSTDDLLTAWLAIKTVSADPPSRFLDLGSGLASVPMIVLWKFPGLSGIGVEIRPNRYELAEKSLEINGLTERFHIIHGDLRELALDEKFDLITSTPPYYQSAEGPISENDDKAAARFELNGSIDDYFKTAAKHLSEKGFFITVYPFLYASRVYAAAKNCGMFINSRVDFIPKDGKQALISIFSASFSETETEQKLLVMRDSSGNHTKEYNDARILCGFKPKK
ncbi:methyltransferase [bacterium]|nr:methyltransferase [bacterium]